MCQAMLGISAAISPQVHVEDLPNQGFVGAVSIGDFPKCVDWKHAVADVKAPDGPLIVSMPCIGANGSKDCFTNVGAV